jgi:hypothetical protein
MFVLKRDDGAYVAKAGGRSYTTKLQHARTWATRPAAERECCANESVSTVEHEMR